jgi:hypothetical protein
VLFLASGDTLWVDPVPDGGPPASLTVRDHGTASHQELRLSARAVLLADPADLASDAENPGRRVPVGLELALEPASQRLTLGGDKLAAGQVTLLRGTGSLAAGSVIRDVGGAGWATAGAPGGPGNGPGAAAEFRARAVFQDGSALYLTKPAVTTGHGAANRDAGDRNGPVAALVHNTQIRPVPVRDLAVREAERGRPGRSVSWSADGRVPAAATAKIRDTRQLLTVTWPDPDGPGRLSWGCAPFVFVRSGVTGLGLVERRARLATPVTDAEPAEELPDPF